MIEINLIAQTKKFKMPTVLGVDLAVVNIKLVVVSLIIAWLSEGYYQDYFGDQKNALNTSLQSFSAELAALREGLQGNEALREELNVYNKQLERLRERSEQVELTQNHYLKLSQEICQKICGLIQLI